MILLGTKYNFICKWRTILYSMLLLTFCRICQLCQQVSYLQYHNPIKQVAPLRSVSVPIHLSYVFFHHAPFSATAGLCSSNEISSCYNVAKTCIVFEGWVKLPVLVLLKYTCRQLRINVHVSLNIKAEACTIRTYYVRGWIWWACVDRPVGPPT